MSKVYNIFVPELVPLDNKGEEAIVRGIADVLFPEGNCEIHLLDEIDEYRYRDGIHIYPVKWFISPWLNREFGLGLNWEKLRDSTFSIIRNLLHKVWPSWVRHQCIALRGTQLIWEKLESGTKPSNDKESRLQQLLDCDYIVAGHDGALDDRVCQIIDVMLSIGKRFGVFGVEFPMEFKSNHIVEGMRSVLEKADFFYCRTQASHEVTQKYFPKIRSQVLADPAFGMIPSSDSVVEEVINKNGLNSFFEKPVIMCTSCEPPPISRYCFESIASPEKKLEAHRQLFAELVKHISDSLDVNILFLPHAIGPGKALDDRVVAKDIIARSGLPDSRVRMLQDLLSGKELKGLIGKAEFMVAERIHSMIGAVGVNTPFLCLGSETDRRIKGIIGGMLGLGENIYYLNRPEKIELLAKFNQVYQSRAEIRSQMAIQYSEMKEKLEEQAQIMRPFIVN